MTMPALLKASRYLAAVLLGVVLGTATAQAREFDRYLIKCTSTTPAGPGMILVTYHELFANNCMAVGREIATQGTALGYEPFWWWDSCGAQEFPLLPATSLLRMKGARATIFDFQCGVEAEPELHIMNLTSQQGTEVAVAILLLWAVAWVFRTIIRVINQERQDT